MNRTQRIEPRNKGFLPSHSDELGLKVARREVQKVSWEFPIGHNVEAESGRIEAGNTLSQSTGALYDLSQIRDRAGVVLFMERLAAENGFLHYFLSPIGSNSQDAVVSNWPSYLVQFLLSNQISEDLIYQDPTRYSDGATRFDFDLFDGQLSFTHKNNLAEIIELSGLRYGTGIHFPGNGESTSGLIALFDKGNSEPFSPFQPAERYNIASTIEKVIRSSCHTNSEIKYKISKRELECIRWTAEGKTSYEISVILNLSENTVNNYIATAARKIGAVNRSHMISIAARSGIIH